MKDIIQLASQRSIFYPSAEIYPNAFSGFYDYGPFGERIRRKIINLWRKELVEKEGNVEIHGCNILPEAVFQASGHTEGFTDPLTQCAKCNALHRADKLLEEKTKQIIPESMSVEEFNELLEKHRIVCPKCKGQLGGVRKFNLLMPVDIGATGKLKGYLRGEACQSIFLDFPRLYKTMRNQMPLGVAQAGSAYRNEIAPRNALVRLREFGQMDLEVFFEPEKINAVERFDEIEKVEMNVMLLGKETEKLTAKQLVEKKVVSGKLIAYYLARVQQLYESMGLSLNKTRFRQLAENEKAFYAEVALDFEVKTSAGWLELIACNYRTDHDLKAHDLGSKKDLSIKNEEGKKFYPHVFEISTGIERTFYAVIENVYKERAERFYLGLPPRVSPYLVSVFPLVKKEPLKENSFELFKKLEGFNLEVFYDAKGSIGKRYARVDEIGVPYAVTYDFQTLEDNTITLRDRDTLKQKRVPLEGLPELLWHLNIGKTSFSKIPGKEVTVKDSL